MNNKYTYIFISYSFNAEDTVWEERRLSGGGNSQGEKGTGMRVNMIKVTHLKAIVTMRPSTVDNE